MADKKLNVKKKAAVTSDLKLDKVDPDLVKSTVAFPVHNGCKVCVCPWSASIRQAVMEVPAQDEGAPSGRPLPLPRTMFYPRLPTS